MWLFVKYFNLYVDIFRYSIFFHGISMLCDSLSSFQKYKSTFLDILLSSLEFQSYLIVKQGMWSPKQVATYFVVFQNNNDKFISQTV